MEQANGVKRFEEFYKFLNSEVLTFFSQLPVKDAPFSEPLTFSPEVEFFVQILDSFVKRNVFLEESTNHLDSMSSLLTSVAKCLKNELAITEVANNLKRPAQFYPEIRGDVVTLQKNLKLLTTYNPKIGNLHQKEMFYKYLQYFCNNVLQKIIFILPEKSPNKIKSAKDAIFAMLKDNPPSPRVLEECQKYRVERKRSRSYLTASSLESTDTESSAVENEAENSRFVKPKRRKLMPLNLHSPKKWTPAKSDLQPVRSKSKLPSSDMSIISSTGSMRTHWTWKEEEALYLGYKRFGGIWKVIKDHYPVLENRSVRDCYDKWRNITKYHHEHTIAKRLKDAEKAKKT